MTVSRDNCYRWIVIYPAYINAKKTQAEGRRIPKSKARQCILIVTESTPYLK